MAWRSWSGVSWPVREGRRVFGDGFVFQGSGGLEKICGNGVQSESGGRPAFVSREKEASSRPCSL